MTASVHTLPASAVRDRDGTSRSPSARHPVLFRVPEPRSGGVDLLRVTGRMTRPGVCRLEVAGELCAYSAPLLAQFLEDEVSGSDVVLDTSSVTFVDSTGISTCLALGERWRGRGRSMVLADPSEVVCRVVRILCLEEVLFGSPPGGDPVDVARSGPSIEVRNLDRGQTIEVVVAGVVDASSSVVLARRLELLATKRQPATLRLDLTDAILDAAEATTILEATRSLDEFGSRLVVVGLPPMSGASDTCTRPSVASTGCTGDLGARP